MPLSRPLIALVVILAACEEEDSLISNADWILSEVHANATSCCFMFETDVRDNQNTIFDELLGLNDTIGRETILSIASVNDFRILKDGHPVFLGKAQINKKTLILSSKVDTLELDLILNTEDSLVVDAQGYKCGISKAKLIFMKGRM